MIAAANIIGKTSGASESSKVNHIDAFFNLEEHIKNN
jgi:hypothetical protein